MNNREKYSKEIINALLIDDDELCAFFKQHDIKHICEKGCNHCRSNIKEWFEEEYKEPKMINRRLWHYLKSIDGLYNYVTIDSINDIFIHNCTPNKGEIFWISQTKEDDILINSVPPLLKKYFDGLISWEDAEPTLIADLLKLEVEEE